MSVPPPTGVTDFVGLVIFVTAYIFSPAVAAIVAPYMVIVICGSLGGSLALSRRPTTTRLQAIGFYLRVVGVAVAFTAGAAYLLEGQWPGLKPRYTIAPIAWIIGYTGDDPRFWIGVGKWLLNRALGAIDTVRGKGGIE